MKHASLVLARSLTALVALLALAAPPCRAEDKAAALDPVTREVRLLHRYDQDPPAAATTMMTFDPAHLVPLKNGLNWVDLDGDGIDDLVVKTRTNHRTVHDFSTYMFIKRLDDQSTDAKGGQMWRTVSLLNEKGLLQIPNITHEWMGGFMRDFRLLVNKRTKPFTTHLIIADRPLEESYGDPSPVTFSILRYAEGFNEPGAHYGEPAIRMVLHAQFIARIPYEDIRKAFLDELHLPDPDPAYIE